MANVFDTIGLVLKLLPLLAPLIKGVESALPDSGGKQKFDVVWNTLQQVFGVVEEQLPVVKALAGALVVGFGFNKSGSVPPPAPPIT